MLSLRVSEQGVEMRHLKSKQESLDHACAEHLVELSELKKANEDLTKRIEMSRLIEKNDDKDEELRQLKTLSDFKNQGAIRVSPQVSPQMRSVAKCDICSFEFISKDLLQKHKNFAHPISVPKPQKVLEPNNVHVDPANHHHPIPVLDSPRQNIVGSRPTGIVRRQYNCHQCDYQGHRSKALYKHSIESGHKKIDSLTETCFTCKQECDNFVELMKHRKSAHYDIISECHGFKAGACRFGDHCYYRHAKTPSGSVSVSNVVNTSDPVSGVGNGSDSFHRGLQEVPPDLAELTQGIQDLMSKFLLGRERQTDRQSGH